MLLLLSYLTIITMISTIILSLPMFMKMMTKTWLESSSSFECGMNPNSMTRNPLSVRFFLLMVLFIVFDIEVTLIIAGPLLMPMTLQTLLFFIMFIMVLFFGLLYEWLEGSLNWKL